MKKSNVHIEIVRSSQPRLSSLSQESCDAIYNVLASLYSQVGITTVNNLADLQTLVNKTPDLVFLGMQFVPKDPLVDLVDSELIWVTSYLDNFGIAYTGSSQMAHEYEVNKNLAKQRVQAAGLLTAPYYLANKDTLVSSDITLPYPLFIKPANRGGGLGIDPQSVVHNFDELRTKVSSIASRFGSNSLIEEYLPGREFSVAILRDAYSSELTAMPIELIAPLNQNGTRILSSQVKSADAERAIGIFDQTLKHKVETLALKVFDALGARDYGRIDIRLDSRGQPNFLEANLLPSLISGYGSFPKACLLNNNLGYRDMILAIVELARTRGFVTDTVMPVTPDLLIVAELSPKLI